MAGDFKFETGNGSLKIVKEGRQSKFVQAVEHITFSGIYAKKIKQPVMYITERAVFELREDGMYLTEIAPGIDMRKDVIERMGFEPKIDGKLHLMDERIFVDEVMGINSLPTLPKTSHWLHK